MIIYWQEPSDRLVLIVCMECSICGMVCRKVFTQYDLALSDEGHKRWTLNWGRDGLFADLEEAGCTHAAEFIRRDDAKIPVSVQQYYLQPF